jgi:hypothetical protein
MNLTQLAAKYRALGMREDSSVISVMGFIADKLETAQEHDTIPDVITFFDDVAHSYEVDARSSNALNMALCQRRAVVYRRAAVQVRRALDAEEAV